MPVNSTKTNYSGKTEILWNGRGATLATLGTLAYSSCSEDAREGDRCALPLSSATALPRAPLRSSRVDLSEDPTALLVTCPQMGDGFVSSKRQDEGTGA